MWILPKNLSLPVSSGSMDTVEMISDLNEQSQACAQSLSVRGTPSSLRTWSAKWKRDSWTQYLSGRMLRTSPQNHSAISTLVSSWLPTPAKESAMPEKDLELTTTATSGPIAENSSELFGPYLSGLKTSRDTSRLDSPQSLPTWKKMVIQRRGEYSARLKSARLTSGKGCLSWPTIGAADARTGFQNRDNGKAGTQKNLETIVRSGPPAPVPASTDGSLRESWASPQTRDNRSGGAERWADKEHRSRNLNDQIASKTVQNAKLNPRWVEMLMGLPLGWTSPDAPASLIRNWKRFTDGWLRAQTERTSCECAATESCPRPQKELSPLYTPNSSTLDDAKKMLGDLL